MFVIELTTLKSMFDYANDVVAKQKYVCSKIVFFLTQSAIFAWLDVIGIPKICV